MTLISSRPAVRSEISLLTHILGVGTAVPPFSATQGEILKFVLERFDIRESTKKLYQKTLSNGSIQKRHFSVRSLEEVLERNHTRISERFQHAATALSAQSVSSALQKAGLGPESIDFLVAATCTGYLCPGITSYLIERLGLRRDAQTSDVTGMGCGAAIPALQQAANFVQSHPGTTAAVVCTEICSAAMFSNDDPDIVISNTIFADGSACVLLQSGPSHSVSSNGTLHPAVREFSSLLLPEWRETLRFVVEEGHLKNVLGKEVPEQSAEAVQRVTDDLLQKTGLSKEDISHWVVHAGGEKIIDAIQDRMDLSPEQLQPSRRVLKNYGNMSSPTVLFVLQDLDQSGFRKPGDLAVLSSFGAGFSAYAALLEY